MCTVTYIPDEEGFFLTSNRDEKMMRKPAILPGIYLHHHNKLIYPKDADAGGTWIAVNANGNTAVLLNGAFVKHTPQPPYVKSRGIIFIEIIEADEPFNKFSHINLNKIEPFTIILFDAGNLYECRWDGRMKYTKKLNKNLPQIWSSSTLYEDEVIKTRESWFKNWLTKCTTPNQHQILNFHQFNGNGDSHNAFIMNRDNEMLTVSITGIYRNNKNAMLQYIDLKENTHTEYRLEFSFAEPQIFQ